MESFLGGCVPELSPTWWSAWALREAQQSSSLLVFLCTLGDALRSEGVPLGRLSLQLRILHPLLAGRSYIWWAGVGGHVEDHPHSGLESATYKLSPGAQIHAGVPKIKRNLTDPAVLVEFPVLGRFLEAGLVDYLALGLPFRKGGPQAVTWASEGRLFSEAEVACLEGLGPAIAVMAELCLAQELSDTIVNTYLGKMAGRRVLDGSIARRARHRLRAVLWYSDLRDFTHISETEPADSLLSILDAHFEQVVAAVHGEGGEVLKFIGDGTLAMFPIDAGKSSDACRRALAAARDAGRRLTGLTVPSNGKVVGFGLALHIGEVVYGNVGAPDRLDFTVVGPAVNRVSRVESLCRELGRVVLATEEFAAMVGNELVPVGTWPLKGIPGAHRLWSLPPEGVASGRRSG